MTTVERGRGSGAPPAPRRPEHRTARVVAVAVGPVGLLAGLLYHPVIGDLTDKAAVAAAMTPDTVRWGLAHLTVGVGAALLLMAFLALHRYLQPLGEHRWLPVAIPFLVLGSTLFAFLPAMEIAMLGALGAGADVRAVLVAMDPWFAPILVAGSATFAVGIVCVAIGLVRVRVPGRSSCWIVAGLLVVSALTRFAPSHPALVVGGVAMAAALWPLAYHMYRHPEPVRTEAS